MLAFSSRARVRRNEERTIRTFASACGRCKLIEIRSHLDGAHYWLAARVTRTGEYPIVLPHRRRHTYRTRTAAEQACQQHLARAG